MFSKEFEDAFNTNYSIDTDGDYDEEITKFTFEDDEDGEVIDQVQKESVDDIRFSFMDNNNDISESSLDDLSFYFGKTIDEEYVDPDMYIGSSDREEEYDCEEDDALDIEAEDLEDSEDELLDDEDGEILDELE